MAENTGKCTNSMPNPKWSQWNKDNPDKNKALNPNFKTIACDCQAFVNADNPKFPNKCTCNHDNKFHIAS